MRRWLGASRRKRGPDDAPLAALRACVDAGLNTTAADRGRLQADVLLVREIAATVKISEGSKEARRAEFEALQQQCEASYNARHRSMGALMGRWMSGLFVGEKLAGTPMPLDNYDLERWFKLPKQHARHTPSSAP